MGIFVAKTLDILLTFHIVEESFIFVLMK